jgi:hypothetical protein
MPQPRRWKEAPSVVLGAGFFHGPVLQTNCTQNCMEMKTTRADGS